MRLPEAVAMCLAIATVGWLDNLWLKVIIVSLLNYSAFFRAAKTLEPIFAPRRASQGPLGATSSRSWSGKAWQAIKIRLCFACIVLAIAHVTSSEVEPYLIMWGAFVLPAAMLVATGLSTREPGGWLQFVTARTADILARFPPFQHIPGPYKKPVALLAVAVAVLWALWFGLEQAFRWIANTKAFHMVKRDSPSIASSPWGPGVMNAAVTLACHAHKTWQEGQEEVATNGQQGAVVEQLTALVDQQRAIARQLTVFTALAAAQQLNAALSQPPTTSDLRHHATASLPVAPFQPIMTPVDTADVSRSIVSMTGSMIELTEMNSTGHQRTEGHVATTPPLALDPAASAQELLHERCNALEYIAKSHTEGLGSGEPGSSGKGTEPPDHFPQNEFSDTDSVNELSKEEDGVDKEPFVGSSSNPAV